MKAVGGQITSFKAYWHRDERNRFWFGRVTCKWPDPPAPAAYRFSHIAPLVKATFFLALWLAAGLLLWWPLLALATCEFVDHVWWWVGSRKPGKDAYKWWHS